MNVTHAGIMYYTFTTLYVCGVAVPCCVEGFVQFVCFSMDSLDRYWLAGLWRACAVQVVLAVGRAVPLLY